MSRILVMILATLFASWPFQLRASTPELAPCVEGEAFSWSPQDLLTLVSPLPKSDTASAVQVCLSQVITYDEEGRAEIHRRTVIRVDRKESAPSEAYVSWQPWYQEKPTLTARVITPDGVEHRLDPSTLGEYATQDGGGGIYSDLRVLKAPLPGIVVGAVIELETIQHDTKPPFAAGTSLRIPLVEGLPLHAVRVSVDYPTTLPVVVKWRSHEKAERPGNAGKGRKKVVIDATGFLALVKTEPMSPVDRVGNVVDITTGASWQTIAESYGKTVDQQLEGADVGELIQSARMGNGGEITAQALLDQLHKRVRYASVAFGAAAIVPRTPADTLKRGFGDCKDQATLLVALLRASGIPAYVALLRATDDLDVDPDMPGASLFNHAIVYVPGEHPVWIDPTSPFARVGELPRLDQGRHALICGGQTHTLMQTPEEDISTNGVDIRGEIWLSDAGPARIAMTSTYRGSLEQMYRNFMTSKDQASLKSFGEELITKILYGKTTTLSTFSDSYDLTVPFQIHLETPDSGRGFTEETQAVAVVPSQLASDLFDIIVMAFLDGGQTVLTSRPQDPLPERKTDLVLPVAYVGTSTWRINPPAGFARGIVPAPRTWSMGPASLTCSYSAGPEEQLDQTCEFNVSRRVWTPADLQSAVAGIRSLSAEGLIVVQFQPVGLALLEAGKTREGIQALHAAIQKHPTSDILYRRLAMANLSIGLRDEAEAAARKAVTLAPASSSPLRTLAWVLRHDEVGRLMTQEPKLAAAEVLYRRAIELDPADTVARMDLVGLLLSYEGDYWRLSRAQSEEVALQIQTLRQKYNEHRLDATLVDHLTRLGHFDQAATVVNELTDTTAKNTWNLVIIACTRGDQAAIDAADHLSVDTSSRDYALRLAGNYLLLLRRYPEAARLISRGAPTADNPTLKQSWAALIGRVTVHEGEQLDVNDPREATLAALLAMTSHDAGGYEDIFDMIPGRLSDPETRKTATEAMAVERGYYLDQAGGVAFKGDSIRDLILSVADIRVEGDSSTGFRVNIRLPLIQTTLSLNTYWIKKGRHLELVGIGGWNSEIGAQALRNIDRGDYDAARVWLNWAREELYVRKDRDVLQTPALITFWPLAQTGGEKELRWAAASVIRTDAEVGRAVEILDAGLAQAPAGEGQLPFLVALRDLFLATGDVEQLLDITSRIYDTHPDSVIAMLGYSEGLEAQRGQEAALAPVDGGLQKFPDNVDLLRRKAALLALLGRHEEQQQILEGLIEREQAGVAVYNNLAWSLHAHQGDRERALSLAQTGISMDGNKPAVLHTLATALASVGRVGEAIGALQRKLTLQGDIDPGTAEWYVMGIIAEQVGLVDVALAYYHRAAQDPSVDPTSCGRLAENRVKALQTVSTTPP